MILFYFLTWQNLFKKKQKQYKTTVLADILEAVLHTTGAECLYHSPMWLKNIECCIYRRESRQPCTRKHKKETIIKWHWGRQRTAEEGGCVITCHAETISDRVRMGKERMICKRKKPLSGNLVQCHTIIPVGSTCISPSITSDVDTHMLTTWKKHICLLRIYTSQSLSELSSQWLSTSFLELVWS